jgi:hypothetical protein
MTLRRALDALREGQTVEPRGLSCQLLAWELAERDAALERLLAEAHRRDLAERSGIDKRGHVLWRLTARGQRFLGHPAGEVAQRLPDASRRPRAARRPR